MSFKPTTPASLPDSSTTGTDRTPCSRIISASVWMESRTPTAIGRLRSRSLTVATRLSISAEGGTPNFSSTKAVSWFSFPARTGVNRYRLSVAFLKYAYAMEEQTESVSGVVCPTTYTVLTRSGLMNGISDARCVVRVRIFTPYPAPSPRNLQREKKRWTAVDGRVLFSLLLLPEEGGGV